MFDTKAERKSNGNRGAIRKLRHRGKKRYNSTAKTNLNFKSPNEIVFEYFSKCNICLDN